MLMRATTTQAIATFIALLLKTKPQRKINMNIMNVAVLKKPPMIVKSVFVKHAYRVRAMNMAIVHAAADTTTDASYYGIRTETK